LNADADTIALVTQNERKSRAVNVEQLQHQHYKKLKLLPPAQERRAINEWFEVDWPWRLEYINKKGRQIDLRSGGYSLILNSDHIKEYMSNNNPSDFDGFLKLRVAVFIDGNTITIRPLP
jgi:hypothetical protein